MQNAEAALQNIQQLNTYTSVGIVTKDLSELDAEFLKSFSVILVGDCDEVCRNTDYSALLCSCLHDPLYQTTARSKS
jgi:hypothetical protein